ncbi:hypothetical protein RCL_jg12823.t1 [Rhizophagus clarus]|uniref:Uncharacterized protein n=1 Tax=Rhizophagus clarus TaxID=94130 RepID=A0A8H3KXS6_9GLOM|nr:hypothetical protein RCL_jg12823.t1 [Rhizophagus clarus]
MRTMKLGTRLDIIETNNQKVLKKEIRNDIKRAIHWRSLDPLKERKTPPYMETTKPLNSHTLTLMAYR